MNRNRLLHILLTTIGVGALLAYVMACRPSWSPDGSKILFPYLLYPESEEVGIALFDKTTGKTRSIFALPAGTEFRLPPRVQWDTQGKRAIVIWAEDEDGTHVRIQPIDSAEPAREVLVRGVQGSKDGPFPAPLPEVDGGLLVIGSSTLARIELDTGKVAEAKLEGAEDYVLFGSKNRAYYARMASGAKPHYEMGTVDAKKLAVTPKLTLRKKDIGKLSPFFSLSRDGSAIAVPGVKKKKWYIHIVSQRRLQKSIPLEVSAETAPGNLQWSPDGKTIYAALVTRQKDRRVFELSAGEITVDTGAMRVTRLLRVGIGKLQGFLPVQSTEEATEVIRLCFQIALSPDGKTIATSPTYLLEAMEDKGDCALHLIDLTTAERKVTKVPFPKRGKK